MDTPGVPDLPSNVPTNLRTTEDRFRASEGIPPTRKGLETLRASAARQFTEAEFFEIVHFLDYFGIFRFFDA